MLEYIYFNTIASWGINNTMVVLCFEKKGEIVKYYFETPQVNKMITFKTKAFQFLLECYSNLIIGKNISDVIYRYQTTALNIEPPKPRQSLNNSLEEDKANRRESVDSEKESKEEYL